jgi:hypothetical protein
MARWLSIAVGSGLLEAALDGFGLKKSAWPEKIFAGFIKCVIIGRIYYKNFLV